MAFQFTDGRRNEFRLRLGRWPDKIDPVVRDLEQLIEEGARLGAVR